MEITDWSGAATNLLASGETLMTLMGTKSAKQTDRIARSTPGALLFRTQTPILVEIYEDAYGGRKPRTRSRITAAKQRDCTQDLGDIYSTRSNEIELTSNIPYALFKGATHRNGQVAVAEGPTNFVVLYGTGCGNPKISLNGNS